MRRFFNYFIPTLALAHRPCRTPPVDFALGRRWVIQAFATLLFALAASLPALAQLCAVPGFTGPTTTLSGTVNTYYAGVAAGASGTTVNRDATAVGAGTAIAVGDMVLIMQMQGADINSTDTSQYGDGLGAANARQDATVPTLPAPSPTVAYNAGTNGTDGYAGGHNASFTAGQYEYAVVTQVVSTTQLRVRGAGAGGSLLYSYTQSAAPNARTYQVIRVPQRSSATLSATVTAPAWNGATGGVVAIDVAGQLTLAAGIDVSQRGFRGGGVRNIAAITAPQFGGYRAALSTNLGGMKGEGYVGTPARTYDSFNANLGTVGATDGYANGDLGRGAPGNAGGGGNQHNAGGGGGGNGGAGGKGGGSWNANTNNQSGWQTGGFGGYPVAASIGPARVFFGGGGGAGDVGGNTSTDPQGSGANGGGIILIRAGSITGTGAFLANGGNAPNTASTDSGGGGGAGGTILVTSSAALPGGLTFQATGGTGGNNTMGAGNPEEDGPGAGGGGGVVYTVAGGVGTVTSGAAGQLTTANTNPNDPPNYYATAGAAGVRPTVALALDTVGSRAGFECLPSVAVTKSVSPGTISLSTGATATYSIALANGAVSGGVTNLSVFDQTLPPGWTLALSPTATYSFSPVTSTSQLGAGAESVATVVPALPGSTATTQGTTFPLRAAGSQPGVTTAAGQNALKWDSFFLPQAGAMTVSFTVSIPDTATIGAYHNPAGFSFLDPTRQAGAPNVLVTPATGNGANRTSTNYSANTTYATGPTSAVAGSNYSGLAAGPVTEDLILLPNLRVTKTASTDTFVSGGTGQYVISAQNIGRPIADQVFATSQATTQAATALASNPMTLTDTMPAGLSVTAVANSNGAVWSCGIASGSGTFTCTATAAVYPIAQGTTTAPVSLVTATATVSVGVIACPASARVNTATLSLSAMGETSSTDNTATTTTAVVCSARLSATKDNGTTTLVAGGTTAYTVTFSNLGPSAADGATVIDVPSAGLSCTVTGCTASVGPPAAACPASLPAFLAPGGTPLPALPSGGTVQFVVTCTVTATGQ